MPINYAAHVPPRPVYPDRFARCLRQRLRPASLTDGRPWVRIDGQRVARSAAEFLSGDWETSLSLTELGQRQQSVVYTGLAVGGNLADTRRLIDWLDKWSPS